MRSRLFAVASAVVLGAVLVAPPGATAATGAPRPPSTARLSASAPAGLIPDRPTPEDVRRALARVAKASDGRVRLGVVGRTNEQRPIRLATVGTGPVRLLYVTQQHGDEPLGTPAAVRALW